MKDPIVDNPSPVVVVAPEPAPEPEQTPIDPKTATQVVIAATQVVSGATPMVERKLTGPKSIITLPNGTIKQDW